MLTGTQRLAEKLEELVVATEASRGPMLPPDLDITSFANQELKLDAEWGDPNTIEQPMYELLAHVELLFHAANDHMRSLGRLLGGDQPNWYGHIAVARAVVETASRLWWLTEPQLGPLERVRRHLMEHQYEHNHQAGLFGGPFRSMPPDAYDAGRADLDARRRRHLDWARSAGLDCSDGRIQGDRPGPMDLLVALYEADPSAGATDGSAGALAAANYNKFSAVAHGLPSGVALHLRAADPASGHGHNVLTPGEIGQVVVVALTAYEAGFDRLAVHFRWPHAELQPLRWAAINQVNHMFE